jgi:Protein of unknown function (DUF3618)
MNTQASGTDPGSKSAAEIEREAQQSRAEVEQTLDAIQARLSPGQLLDQAVGYFREGRGGEFARTLGDSIVQNPIPLTLVGVGLAWMMLGGQRFARNGEHLESDDWDDDPEAIEEHYVGLAEESVAYTNTGADLRGSGYGVERGGFGEDLRERGQAAKERLGEFGDQARDAADRARERVERVGARVAGRAQDARERVGRAGAKMADRAHDARRRAQHYGRRARQGVLRSLDEQPLVLGAIGLAIGAALGAALPPSRAEDELMGEARDEALRRATRAGRKQAEKARAAAGAVAGAAREEAGRQGLTPESSSAPGGATSSHRAGGEVEPGEDSSARPASDTPYPADPKATLDRP